VTTEFESNNATAQGSTKSPRPFDPSSLRLPTHIAIVMDGNGRWAQKRHLPRVAGHRAGVDSLREIVSESARLNIQVLTVFAFSSENWQRPKEEVSFLMELFYTALEREVKKLHKRNVRLRIIGEKSSFSAKLQEKIASAEELTKNNTGLQFNIAANYGGQWDIVNAAQQIALAVERKELQASDITTEVFNRYMSLGNLPAPDLLIRTSGEQRISNFLLWDLAYSELFFCKTYWPDFNTTSFHEALQAYSDRQRRFGLISKQLLAEEGSKECLNSVL
jgi:undecaprenyl diphosphate synthase